MEALSAKYALLNRLIDDASLYPPANLALAPSLRAHARGRESAYAFMQGRYVAPASVLRDLLALRDPNLPLHLSVILDLAEGADAFDGALARISELGAADGIEGVAIESIEFRLPAETGVSSRIEALADALAPRAPLAVWAEPRFSGDWAAPLDATFATLAGLRDRHAGIAFGAKLRTGGLTADAIPPVTSVAAFIIAAQRAGVAWKATAGLHHPVRHVDAASGLTMHGFLNVFVAGIAHGAGRADASSVEAIVAEEDPRAFVLDPEHAGWRDLVLDVATIEAGRASCVSFGSCSFFEPVDDLRRLGLLA